MGSVLLPRHLRKPIAVIYRFARTADDIADEGIATTAERLEKLEDYQDGLNRIAAGAPPQEALFTDLAEIITDYRLPIQLFRDLIDAFTQDVVKIRYSDFRELMDYCRRSADPIGRLLLHLFELTSPRYLAWSDAICSSLQQINFWQDVAIDWEKGRVYLPQEDLRAYGVSESHIANRQADARWQRLMQFQIDRSRAMLESGAALGRVLPGRMGLEIRATIAGGATILHKLDAVGGDIFRHRPLLKMHDWSRILYRAFFPSDT